MNGLMRSCRADPLGSTQNERIPIRLAHVKLGLVSHCVVGTRFYQGGDKQDGCRSTPLREHGSKRPTLSDNPTLNHRCRIPIQRTPQARPPSRWETFLSPETAEPVW